MALGAQRWRLLWDVAAEGAQLTLGSVVIGVVIDSPLQSVARSLLYRVAAAELVNMVSTTGLLLSVAIVASLVPALRYSYRSDRGLRLTERGERRSGTLLSCRRSILAAPRQEHSIRNADVGSIPLARSAGT